MEGSPQPGKDRGNTLRWGVGLEEGYELPLDVSDVAQANQVPLVEACGVVIDPATGELFVSSRKIHQVWQVEPGGNAFLVAGTGKPGFSGDGSLAVHAELNGPRGLALGRDGSLYIAEQDNSRARRILPNGQITTVAGCGSEYPSSSLPDTEARLSRPDGLAFGPDGAAYVGGAYDEATDEPPQFFRASSPTGDAFLGPTTTSCLRATDSGLSGSAP